MPTITTPVLRRTLQVDSLTGLMMAASHLLATQALSGWLGLPPVWLHLSAAIALGAALLAGALSRQSTPAPALTLLLAAGNLLWVLASVWLVWAAPVALTTLGQAWVLIQAATVLVLAVLEAAGAMHLAQHHAMPVVQARP